MRKKISKFFRKLADKLDPPATGGYIANPIRFGNPDSPPEYVLDGKKLTDLVMRSATRAMRR
jgi:hypothetical protein